MVFLVADSGAASGGAAAATMMEADPAATAATAATTGPIDCKALLLQLLDLDPAADDAAIQAAFDKEESEPEDDVDIAALQTKASTADQLQVQLDEINAKYTELNNQQQALYKAKQEADADEILKVYEPYFTDDASKAAIRNILLSDKDAGIAILNGLKKPDAAAIVSPDAAAAAAAATETKTATPPSPQHDPNAAAAATSEEELAKKISDRAKELVKTSNPKISLTKAYQLAETELKPAAA
jgi:hypothetical protein